MLPIRLSHVLAVVVALAAVLLMPPSASAEAWTFTYSHRDKTYTYPTYYASRQEAANAFRAWRRDRYSGDRRPPELVRINYRPNLMPDRQRYPY
jgi:hypothetical protein